MCPFCLSRASLVPVFAFGENDLFNQVANPRGSWLRDVQQKIQKMVAFAPVLFYGRGIFQYTFGMLPHRKPVNVVGKSKNNHVVSENIHTSPTEGFFWFEPSSPPWNFQFSFILSFKNFEF